MQGSQGPDGRQGDPGSRGNPVGISSSAHLLVNLIEDYELVTGNNRRRWAVGVLLQLVDKWNHASQF